MRKAAVSLIAIAITACGLAATSVDSVTVTSPDGNVRVNLRIASSDGRLLYSINRAGLPVVAESSIDVTLSGLGSCVAGAVIDNVVEKTHDETSDLLWGKAGRIRNHYRAATIRLKSKHGIVWALELRAYNHGVAWRYEFPEQAQLHNVVIEDEDAEFRLAGDPTLLFSTCDNFTTSHEALYDRKPLAEIPLGKLMEKPLLALWPDGSAAAITEASLRNFAGMYLESARRDGKAVLRTRLSPLPSKSKSLVNGETPLRSPWRVVMLADRAGQLIESNLLLSLNDAPDRDFSWVKPGKTTFHWWNGTVEHGPASTPETNFAIHKSYIDFCARNGIAYHSVISVAGNLPWFVQAEPGFHDLPHADTDILTPRPDLDLPHILAYAKEKGVGIRFWVHWKPLSEKLEEAFAQYERWGVRGLMVDFMDRDDQHMVEWQEKCLRVAAKHNLHIQFHGSYAPTGEQRTYPNLFNREGVLNLEYLKWSDLCTPAHSVDVAYTRLLAGPVDYHLGGFRAVTRQSFRPHDLRPNVLGTRAHQLALYIVFENPMPMLADAPEAYENQPGFDFLVHVPTTWDETRFVAGEPGEFVTIARRRADKWYLGGITNWDARTIKIPLRFLGDGEFEATLYRDSSRTGASPNDLQIEKRPVSSKDTLRVSLLSGGGVAAMIRPID